MKILDIRVYNQITSPSLLVEKLLLQFLQYFVDIFIYYLFITHFTPFSENMKFISVFALFVNELRYFKSSLACFKM